MFSLNNPYCFIVYAFVVACNILLAGPCTLHSRKFPTSHRYILTFALGCDFVSFDISQVKTCIHPRLPYKHKHIDKCDPKALSFFESVVTMVVFG